MKHILLLDSPFLFPVFRVLKIEAFFSDMPHLLLFLYFFIPSLYNNKTGLCSGVIYNIIAEFLLADPPVSPIRTIIYSENT